MRIVKYLTGVLWAAIFTSMSGREWDELIGMSGLKEKILTKGSSLRSKVVVTAGSNALGECTVLMTRYQRT